MIDGQHRIAGLYKYEGEVGFDINVTIFVGTDIADQAQIFSTVNLEQTKVNRSLAYDLFALAHSRSPKKRAIILLLRWTAIRSGHCSSESNVSELLPKTSMEFLCLAVREKRSRKQDLLNR